MFIFRARDAFKSSGCLFFGLLPIDGNYEYRRNSAFGEIKLLLYMMEFLSFMAMRHPCFKANSLIVDS